MKDQAMMEAVLAMMGEAAPRSAARGAKEAGAAVYSDKPGYDEAALRQMAAERGVPESSFWRSSNEELAPIIQEMQTRALSAEAEDVESGYTRNRAELDSPYHGRHPLDEPSPTDQTPPEMIEAAEAQFIERFGYAPETDSDLMLMDILANNLMQGGRGPK